eukprot:scaffold11461_cov104-Isochrysis_galbana.AAC.8
MIVSTYNREIAPLYEHFAGASVARCASETEAESTLRGIQAAVLTKGGLQGHSPLSGTPAV